MCADSLASCARRGVDALARRLEHARHRVLGEPVDLQLRDAARAARARSPGRAARGRGRSGDETKSARADARVAAARRAARRAGAEAKLAQISRLTRTGSRAAGEWPAPATVTSFAPVSLGERDARVRTG